MCTYIHAYTYTVQSRDLREYKRFFLSLVICIPRELEQLPTLKEMRQGGTFETRAAHNKSHHRCGRRPRSSGLSSAREAAPRGAQRDRSERGLRIGALVHDVHDDDERFADNVLRDRQASRARRTIEIARPEVSSRRYIAH